MSDGVTWDFQLSGDAKAKLEALDAVIAKMPRDLGASEKALDGLNRALAAQSIAKMSDPLRQNQALLKLHTDQLKREEDQAKKTADAEDKLQKSMSKAATDAKKADDELAKTFGVDKIAAAMTLSGAIEKVGETLVEAGRAAIDAAIQVGKFGVESAQKTRRQTFSLGITEGDNSAAVLANIRKMADSAAVSADKTIERFTALRRAGVSAGDAQLAVAAALDTGARNGGGEAGERAADAVVEALRKAKQTGKVEYLELFDQLGKEANIGSDKIVASIASAMGVSNAKAMEQLKAGKVPVATVEQAVLGAIQSYNPGGKLGDTAKAFGAGDLEGQMQRLHDTAANLFPSDFGAGGVRALKTVGDLLNNEPYKGAIKGIVDDFGKLLGGPDNATIETILRTMIGFVRDGIDGVKELKAGFDKGFPSEAIAKMNEQFDKMNAAMGGSKENSKALENIGFIVGQIAMQAAFWLRVFEMIDKSVTSVKDSLFAVAKLEIGALKDLTGLGKSASDGLASGLSAGSPGVEKASADVGRIPLQVIKAILKIQSPSKEMEQLGIYSGQGFSLGLEKEDPGVALEASLAPTRGGAGAGGGGGVTISFGDIIVSGAGAGAGEAVRDEVYTAILQVIEELGLA